MRRRLGGLDKISNGGIDVVDPDKIRKLVEMMSENELSEICIRDGADEILLRRPGAAPIQVAMPQQVTAPVQPLADAVASVQPPAAATPTPTMPTASADEGLTPIKSPMVGTFYAAPDPQSPTFVKTGDHVTADTVVCIVEAMKVFNEIKAEISGTIERVMVKNEAPVEFGQPLFMVKPD